MDEKRKKWWGSIWFILLMLLVLGPVGFIFLWPSKRFSLTWKIILTILTILATVWMFVAGGKVIAKFSEQMKELVK